VSRAAPRRRVRLALVGFGSVGRRFVERLLGAYGRVLRGQGLEVVVTGIATGRHGLAVDPAGLPLRRALALVRAGRQLGVLHRGAPLRSTRAFLAGVPADVLLELSPLEPETGQPATATCAAALRRGLHVVTANKGPVAFAAGRLRALARASGVRFLHEGAVMDGVPVFNLAGRCLRGATVTGFRGVLNSTTTRILARLEQGATFTAALAEARAAGVAEADPRHDLEGFDAALKACALANALLGAQVRPGQVARTGIGAITPAAVRRARATGRRLRLVARARVVAPRGRRPRRVEVSVAPEALPLDDLLASSGADGVLVLETDLLGEVGLWEGAGGVDQTAYALLSDLLEIASPAPVR